MIVNIFELKALVVYTCASWYIQSWDKYDKA